MRFLLLLTLVYTTYANTVTIQPPDVQYRTAKGNSSEEALTPDNPSVEDDLPPAVNSTLPMTDLIKSELIQNLLQGNPFSI
ncbi:unnamed protein product [Gongylonema pulchrum]|uniref:Secreted protein n=1 Tax=Gongylonema pulchrum TaxID=637853 RepID=A0A183E205_9BILA|nr:unnamed protein product [Gongylonema pulchrum]